MDLTVLPTLYALIVFVCCFRPLVRRAGSHTDVWFVGWAILLVHYIAMLLPEFDGQRGELRTFFAVASFQVCGLCFMAAAWDARTSRVKRLLLAEIGLASVLQAFVYSFDSSSLGMRLFSTTLLFLPALHLLLLRHHRPPAFGHIAVACALLALGGILSVRTDPIVPPTANLCALYMGAAYLTYTHAGRLNRGAVMVIAGLSLWGISFPLQSAGLLPADFHLARAILDIPRYLTAAGMILSLIDGYVATTERQAMHDALTGLPNRRLFDSRLQGAIEESHRTRTPVACLVIDVDNFKWINDTLGHPVGDDLLRALARRLSWNLGPRDVLARTGGDEFTAVLVEAADEFHVRFVAGAMMAASCVPVSVHQHSIDVRISMGIAISPAEGTDTIALHKAADDAMYCAKRQGGGTVVFAGEELPETATARDYADSRPR